jgi:GAF domain-containing protein
MSILDINVLLPQVVELVRARFGLHYVGLFLLDDENRFAVLRAGSGEPGRQMLARGWRLPVGGSSMIGQCIETGVASVQMDVRQASVHLDNPLLPDTRSELALPLRVRGQTIGAMSVQSVATSAFDEVTVSALQTVANQVAIACANAQLYAEAQAALAEIRAVQGRYQAQTWREYLQTTLIDQYETALPDAVPLGDAVLPEIREAVAQRRATVHDGNHAGGASQSTLVAPITLRGEVIGVLGIHDEREDRLWTEEDISLVEEVVERLALTIDSLSLLDRTLRSEAQERTIAEVSSRIRGSLDLETVLRTAVDEVQRVLGLDKVAVRLTAGQVGEDPV